MILDIIDICVSWFQFRNFLGQHFDKIYISIFQLLIFKTGDCIFLVLLPKLFQTEFQGKISG